MLQLALSGGGGAQPTLADFLSNMTTFFTSLIAWFTSLIDFVVANPVLLVFLLIALAGIVISIVRRWLPGRA